MKVMSSGVAQALGKALSMIRKLNLRRLLASQPLSGRFALLVGAIAVLIPTGLLAAFDGTATAVAVAPYVPFILISALLLTWWNASLVAVVSAVIDDVFFVGTPHRLLAGPWAHADRTPHRLLEGPEDVFMLGVFMLVAAMIIGFVQLVRRMVVDRAAAEERSGIIFSLEDGQAWASRPGLGTPVRLGPEAEVADMMQDFLAQRELAQRLNKSSGRG